MSWYPIQYVQLCLKLLCSSKHHHHLHWQQSCCCGVSLFVCECVWNAKCVNAEPRWCVCVRDWQVPGELAVSVAAIHESYEEWNRFGRMRVGMNLQKINLGSVSAGSGLLRRGGWQNNVGLVRQMWKDFLIIHADQNWNLIIEPSASCNSLWNTITIFKNIMKIPFLEGEVLHNRQSAAEQASNVRPTGFSVNELINDMFSRCAPGGPAASLSAIGVTHAQRQYSLISLYW